MISDVVGGGFLISYHVMIGRKSVLLYTSCLDEGVFLSLIHIYPAHRPSPPIPTFKKTP